MEKIINTIKIEKLNIEIIEIHDDYWLNKHVNYISHFQVNVNNMRLMALYFDLETALLSSIIYSINNSTQTTIELTEGIRNMLGLNVRDVKNIIKIDGEESTDGECLDSIITILNIKL